MSKFTDLRIHVQRLAGAGYPVVLTLNDGGEQELGDGMLTASSVLPWVRTPDAAHDGERLFESLFSSDSLKRGWARARGQAPNRRIRLHIDHQAPELHTIPWELLREPAWHPISSEQQAIPALLNTLPRDLAASRSTPFSRFLAGEWRQGKPVSQGPIRILAAVANPLGLDRYGLRPIDVDQELALLRDAVSIETASAAQRATVTSLVGPCTLAAIESELAKGYHVFHLVAHGGFSQTDRKAALFLASADNRDQPVSDREFAGMLGRQMSDGSADQGNRLRLVFLASCSSARRDTADAMRGLAPQLVAAGAPAVLAMQEDVPIISARAFAKTFYNRLLDHGLVDLASNEARSHLISARFPGRSIPVLFMRLKDGRLFDPGSPVDQPADSIVIIIIMRPADLKSLLRSDIYTYRDLSEELVSNLGYSVEALAGPNITKGALANRLVEQAVADGKQEKLVAEMQACKPNRKFEVIR